MIHASAVDRRRDVRVIRGAKCQRLICKVYRSTGARQIADSFAVGIYCVEQEFECAAVDLDRSAVEDRVTVL